jgi:hypothetical protein
LYLAFVLVAFVSCKDDYGTGEFTGEYRYTEESFVCQIFRGDTVYRTGIEVTTGEIDVTGYSGKITAKFQPDGMPYDFFETRDYVISGDAILGTPYIGDVVLRGVTFPNISFTEEGYLESGHLFIEVAISGQYNTGLEVGFIKGYRRIRAEKR